MKTKLTAVERVVMLLSLGLLLMGAVAGTASRWVGNLLVFDGTTGNNAFAFDVDGLRGDFGSGSDDYLDSNGSYARVGAGAGYLASAQPFTLSSVYINNVISAVTYGGATLPARAFTVTGIRWNVRTAGSGGTTNDTFQVSDGTNTCNCTMACNQSTGSKRASCTNGAGTGCAYAASAALTYSFSALGDCATPMDVNGNLDVEGNWQ